MSIAVFLRFRLKDRKDAAFCSNNVAYYHFLFPIKFVVYFYPCLTFFAELSKVK